MKSHLFLRHAALFTALFLAFGLAARSDAQHNTNDSAIVHASTIVATLNDAYATLAQIKHPYKGHREQAMKQIASALKELGGTVNVHHAKALEPHSTADTQLKAAVSLLQPVNPGLSDKALQDIEAAIVEINDALANT
jgi:hypothetical protein